MMKQTLIQLLVAGLGGFFGAASRHAVGLWMGVITSSHWFPGATLVVNVLGCLLIGVLGRMTGLSGHWRLFVITGVLGGLTTFSSFGFQSLELMRDRNAWFAVLNVALHLVLGLGAVWIGYWFMDSRFVQR
jgi:CrcB protein